MVDAMTKVAVMFPTHSLVTFWIIANLIINNQPTCAQNDRGLVVAILVIFCILIAVTACTDTYTASNRQKFAVLLIPFYGPACFGLPTLEDKQRVYQYFYIQMKDVLHAFFAVSTFLLISIFTNPVCMCLFPGDIENGTARFDTSIVRTIPIVVAILGAVVFMCIGEPRQSLGFNNVLPTVPDPNAAIPPRSVMGFSGMPGPMEQPIHEGATDDGMGMGAGSMQDKSQVRMYPQGGGPTMARMSAQPRTPSGRSGRSHSPSHVESVGMH